MTLRRCESASTGTRTHWAIVHGLGVVGVGESMGMNPLMKHACAAVCRACRVVIVAVQFNDINVSTGVVVSAETVRVSVVHNLQVGGGRSCVQSNICAPRKVFPPGHGDAERVVPLRVVPYRMSCRRPRNSLGSVRVLSGHPRPASARLVSRVVNCLTLGVAR